MEDAATWRTACPASVLARSDTALPYSLLRKAVDAALPSALAMAKAPATRPADTCTAVREMSCARCSRAIVSSLTGA